jgi:hypothetical protein
MKMDEVRIEGARTAIAHWTGRYKATHLLTGKQVEWDEAWNDDSRRKNALESLKEKVETLTETPPPQD